MCGKWLTFRIKTLHSRIKIKPFTLKEKKMLVAKF